MAINLHCSNCKSSSSIKSKYCKKCGRGFINGKKKYRVVVNSNGKRISKVVTSFKKAKKLENKLISEAIDFKLFGIVQAPLVDEIWKKYLSWAKEIKKSWKQVKEFEKAVKSATKSHSKVDQADALDGLSHAFRIIGQFDKAIDCCKKALTIYEKIGDPILTTTSKNSLSLILSAAGKPNEALKFGFEALASAKQMESPKHEGFSHNYIGCAFLSAGRYPSGIEHMHEALEIFKNIGYSYGVSFALNYLGSALALTGEYQPSIDNLKEGLKVSESTGEPRGKGYCAFNLARVYCIQGDYENAKKYIGIAIDAFRRANTLHLKAAQSFLSSLECKTQSDAVGETVSLLKCVKELIEAGDFFMECVNILDETEKLAKEYDMPDVLQNITKIREGLAVQLNILSSFDRL